MIDLLTVAGEIYLGLSVMDDVIQLVMRAIEKYLKLKQPKPPNENVDPPTG